MGKFVKVHFAFARKETRTSGVRKWLKETRLGVGSWWVTQATSMEIGLCGGDS
jgi:hypothetical protein